MACNTVARCVLCAVMAWQGYQLGHDYGRALQTWVQTQDAPSTLRISRP